MHRAIKERPARLEDIPNIGKVIAADLRAIGIPDPQQLAMRGPLSTFLKLKDRMGKRHDPCVLYTLLAARHFLESGEAIPWWKFTGPGRELLLSQDRGRSPSARRLPRHTAGRT